MIRRVLGLCALAACGSATPAAPIANHATASDGAVTPGLAALAGHWDARGQGMDDYWARFEFTVDGEFTWAQGYGGESDDACPTVGAVTLGPPRAGDLPVLELRPRSTPCETRDDDPDGEPWRWQPMTWTHDRIDLLSALYEFADPAHAPRTPDEGGDWLLLTRATSW